MKRYIANRSLAKIASTCQVSHFEAGRDFLATVLTFAAIEAGAEGDEVALTA